MFKLFVLLSLFQLSAPDFGTAPVTAMLECPDITNVQKTGQTASSVSFSWNSAGAGAQYKVWYVRQEDNYFSGYSYTGNTAYSFTGLTPGHYTFYFQHICGEESSDYIGVEEVIAA